MILRFDSGFDSTFFGFKIRFEDLAESSNLKIRESYDSTITGNLQFAPENPIFVWWFFYQNREVHSRIWALGGNSGLLAVAFGHLVVKFKPLEVDIGFWDSILALCDRF